MITYVLAALIALIHVYIFILESIVWRRARTRKLFGMSEEDSRIAQPFAFNQGFYNLFLSLAILTGGLMIFVWDRPLEGRILMDYGTASVLGAGLVLFFSAPKMRQAAFIQAGPALLYFSLRFFL
jgi:putative membrane protein